MERRGPRVLLGVLSPERKKHLELIDEIYKKDSNENR